MSVECTKCIASNRDAAKYCKYCGAKISASAFKLQDLVGIDEVKKEIQRIINIVKSMDKDRERGRSIPRLNLHTILIGNTGTGKSKIGEILCGIFHRYGITIKEDAVIVDAVGYSKFAKDIEKNFKKAKGGILFIDNVHKLVPAGFSSELDQIDKLITEMSKHKYDPIVVLAGLPKGLKEYIDENPNIKGRFKHIFELPDFDMDQLYQIASNELKKQGFNLSEDAQDRLKKRFQYLVKTKNVSFGNAHVSLDIVDDIVGSYYLRVYRGELGNNLIIPEDIKGEILEEKTVEEILKELDSLVGMENIKTEIKDLFTTAKIEREKAIILGTSYIPAIHVVMTGNPGTGKTTIANKLGEILQAIGILDRGHVVSAERKDLVAPYVGQTAPKTNSKIDEAIGGILFIDEAYTLAPEGVNDSFGKEAIDTLLTRMENDRGKFITIAAGYPKEMDNFINANPGLKSRFNRYFHFDDYKPDELFGIFNIFAKYRKYELKEEAEKNLKNIFTLIYSKRDKNFANGREVRNIFDECIALQSKRLSAQVDRDAEELFLIRVEDIPPKYKLEREITVKDAIKKLDALIGLDLVKNEVRSLINYLNVEKARAAKGGKETTLNLHFVFTGNPGTGKTTVARILADVFKAMGLLYNGQLVEVDRSGLVAQYVGQTAPKTNKVIDSAIGGVLFIDEAYALTPRGRGGGTDFGKEAIDTLLKRMEDDRGKFIIIAAGYSEPMEDFINANPGLKSRFTKFIDFPDYKPDELKGIFELMVRSEGRTLADNVNPILDMLFKKIYEDRDDNFANGRTVRNIFQGVLQNLASRIAEPLQRGESTPEMLNTITENDFESMGV